MEPIILPRISDQKPLVSVVSITYNHEPYIRNCLEGFLMQKTDFPIEVIIHDDASTDHTADIIRDYYEKHPDLFHVIIERENQFSQGKSVPLPLYQQAKGKYIAICEGDDYWTDPLKLQKQFDFMEKNQEYIAVVHRYDVINKFGIRQNIKTFGYYDEEQAGKYTLRDYEKGVGLPSQLATLMFRNVFLDNKEFYPKRLEKNNAPGDKKLVLLFLLHGDIYRMKDTMSVYRFVREIGGQSWTSRALSEADPYQYWKDHRELEQFAKEYGKIIDFRIRKLNVAPDIFMRALKGKNLRYVGQFIEYVIKQDGSRIYLLRRTKNKIKRVLFGK